MSDGNFSLVLAVVYLLLWYCCSGVTLVLNKYVLSYLGADPDILGCSQMAVASVCGGANLFLWRLLGRRSSVVAEERQSTFYRDIGIVGFMRFGSVVLSLVSLKLVAASFVETVKATAPVFTVIIAYLMLGEESSLSINLSLIPIMGGLVLTSYTEISFNAIGFSAAVANNILDCVQNVFCKKLLSGLHAYTAIELQFYTSTAAILIQLPLMVFLRGSTLRADIYTTKLIGFILLDSVFFHLQSLFAYLVVSVISPVSYSVSNTAKRALLTFFTIIIFHNPMTILTVIGMFFVIGGVFVYNFVRQHEETRKQADRIVLVSNTAVQREAV